MKHDTVHDPFCSSIRSQSWTDTRVRRTTIPPLVTPLPLAVIHPLYNIPCYSLHVALVTMVAPCHPPSHRRWFVLPWRKAGPRARVLAGWPGRLGARHSDPGGSGS